MTELLVASDYRISYNSKTGRYSVVFESYSYEQRLCEFLSTFNFLKTIDLEYYLLNIGNEYDTVTVPLSLSGMNIVLPLDEYIIFRNMYMEELFRLKLENMLHSLCISLPTAE